MITRSLLNKNTLTRRHVAISDTFLPLVMPPALSGRAQADEAQNRVARMLNKVEVAVEPSHYSDEALLQLIVRRDADALSELYDRHAQMMYNLIVRIVKEPAAAEHILQEAFWQVWQKSNSYTARGSVGAWLYRIARNKSLDHLRRQKARPQVADQAISEQVRKPVQDRSLTEVEMEAGQALQREQVRNALSQIPAEQRYCLELAYFNGMSQCQIAEHTETPLGTIKTRVRQGLKKLERILRTVGYRNADFLLLLFFTASNSLTL